MSSKSKCKKCKIIRTEKFLKKNDGFCGKCVKYKDHIKLKIPDDLREKVWKKYFGNNSSGKCFICETPIIFKGTIENRGYDCAHVESEYEGGPTTIKNLRPCCRSCNCQMGTQNMYTWATEKSFESCMTAILFLFLKFGI